MIPRSFKKNSHQKFCPICIKLWLPRNWSNYTFDHDTFKEVDFSYYPHPECKVHIPTLTQVKTEVRPSPFGPIKMIRYKKVPPGAPYIVLALVDPPLHMSQNSILVGRGVDYDLDLAEKKAIMEGLERYCACSPPRARLHWGTPTDFQDSTAVIVNDPSPRWWCEANNLTTPNKVMIPLEYVQLESLCTVKNPIVKRDSTGMAVHPDYEACLKVGITEVLERVGLVQFWGKPLSNVWSPHTFPTQTTKLAKVCEMIGYEIITAITNPIIGFTSCIVILHRNKESGLGPALVCGSGGGWNTSEAINRGLTEAYAQLLHALEIWPCEPEPNLPRLYDHFLYYLDMERANMLLDTWCVRNIPKVSIDNIVEIESEVNIKNLHIGTDILTIDRGNVLTDYLGLSAIQVMVPELPLLEMDTPGSDGLPHPFA
ncbi:YcaO-like family protein [Bacillus sp. IBL03825]|uniref:YcaO-like family protein n=1 Tax=Bacillus sp. IBL03825 TaxID=2953580 RepID=UPI002158130C|nr:YcaO-like family protein [Bacillus sp. IBL03825]MCR6850382.1 YcaO-like family protein [Bacillus sp. IBL03825]